MRPYFPEEVPKQAGALGFATGWLAAAVLAAAGLCGGMPGYAQAPPPAPAVKLSPRFVPGMVMRYEVQLQTQSATKRTGSFSDPQGPSQLSVSWDATVRLEVLSKMGQPSSGLVRVRTTYEKSTATVRSDTPDPAEADIEKQYAQLAGRSIEFTLSPDGRVSEVRGLEGMVGGEKSRQAVEQWISQLSAAASLPPSGIVRGQKWTSDQPADTLPLAGLVWRTTSTYLRNEPCRPANPVVGAGASGDNCAVILSGISLVTKRSGRDMTPPEYRRNGLRTSGHWAGSGDGLSYVSLTNGWVVSTTQNGAEQMDVTVVKPGETSVGYAGTVRTHSSISLVPGHGAGG